jgi:2-oxoglutarate dehydrogenase E1 component
MTNLEEVVWCQEEPNNGSWFFVEPFIEEGADAAQGQADPRALCRTQGRRARPPPASPSAIQAEQGALVADALGHSVRAEIRRQQKG